MTHRPEDSHAERGDARARETIAHAPHGHGGAHPPAEEDRVQSRAIVVVGVAALVVFLVASVATGLMMRNQQRELLPQGPPPLPQELGSSKIGLLEQRLFENANQAEAMREVQQRKLESYGWVDPAQGIVRMPIARAMELVQQGARPVPTPAAGAGARPDAGAGAPAPTSAQGVNEAGRARPADDEPSQRSVGGGVRR